MEFGEGELKGEGKGGGLRILFIQRDRCRKGGWVYGCWVTAVDYRRGGMCCRVADRGRRVLKVEKQPWQLRVRYR